MMGSASLTEDKVVVLSGNAAQEVLQHAERLYPSRLRFFFCLAVMRVHDDRTRKSICVCVNKCDRLQLPIEVAPFV